MWQQKKKKNNMKKALIIVGIILIGIQVFRIDKTNPATTKANDFITLTNPNAEVAEVLKTACYNCHSNNTQYPWYADVAPVSWWIKHHVDEAQEELNFSEWGNYSEKKKLHKLHECYEEVEEGEMPLSSYLIMHKEAKLSAEQRELLEDWFKSFGPFEDKH